MKAQAHSFLETPLEYNQDKTPLIKVSYDLSIHFGSYRNIQIYSGMYSFRLVPQEKAGKEIPESSKLELLEKF